MRRLIFEKDFKDGVLRQELGDHFIKKWTFCGSCELTYFNRRLGTTTTIKEVRTISEFRDPTFYELTEDEVHSIVVSRII